MDDAARLAEYSTLREESLACQEAQREAVKLNITASGAVAGLAIANSELPGLLVILAFLSPVVGLLWIDLDSKVHRVARYISGELWVWTPSWELWLLSEKPKERLTRFAGHGVPSVVVFVCPAVAGLIVSGHHRADIGGNVVWLAAFVPLLLYVVVGIGYLVTRQRVSPEQPSRPVSQSGTPRGILGG